MDYISKLALGSIFVAFIVLGLKAFAFYLTDSVALYSDALESIINVVVACALFLAVRLSAKPADETHNYGHYKAEYFSAVLEGVLIVLAALSIFYEAYQAFNHPRILSVGLEALIISGLASLINGVWCWILIQQGRLRRSPALIADGKHLLADVFSSVGVIVGIVLASMTKVWALDPLLAILVAVNILWSGWGLVRDSVGGLMDAAPAPQIMQRIRQIISIHSDGALEAHELRTRQAGRATFIDFHLVVPSEMTVLEAHSICDRIEEALEKDVAGAIVTIHVEPEGEAKQVGVVVL